VLIQAGVVSEEAMKKETLTFEELISVLNKNGFNNPADVEECVLEPNGTFFVKGKTPTSETVHSRELLNAVERLTAEVMAMRAEMQARG
jgi:uncharacterized membrane protein YcaP (DUF421 family)